jgi:hypothetical protein
METVGTEEQLERYFVDWEPVTSELLFEIIRLVFL